jgi:hypothetical protein
MPVYLLQHKSPGEARTRNELLERIVVRANSPSEARDLATGVSPIPDGPSLDWMPVWVDAGKTDCDDVTVGDSELLAVQVFGSPRR